MRGSFTLLRSQHPSSQPLQPAQQERNTPSPSPCSPFSYDTPPLNPTVPTIRLVAATPSEPNASFDTAESTSFVSPWAEPPPPPHVAVSGLAPKQGLEGASGPRKRLVPKRSKSKLGSTSTRDKENRTLNHSHSRDDSFSDVVRRVGASTSHTARRGGSGFEIYVDPANDDEGVVEEVVIIKKKKSRAGLDGMRWGPGALGEVTNVPSTAAVSGTVGRKEGKEKESKKKGRKEEEKEGKRSGSGSVSGLLRVKTSGTEEKDKWWSIGRGKKDLKEKKEERERAASPEPSAPSSVRARFNSLDSRALLGSGPTNPSSNGLSADSSSFPASSSSDNLLRVPSPTAVPALVPLPPDEDMAPSPTANPKGSVAIRAMRSMRSLARIGSWNQLRSMPSFVGGNGGGDEDLDASKSKSKSKSKDKDKDRDEDERAKRRKEKKEKEKEKEKSRSKSKDPAERERKSKSKYSSKSKSKSKASTIDRVDANDEDEDEDDGANQGTLRWSAGSSFEAGSLSPPPYARSFFEAGSLLSPPCSVSSPLRDDGPGIAKTLGRKKSSILGLAGFGSMRLQRARSGSTRSAGSVVASAFAAFHSSSTPPDERGERDDESEDAPRLDPDAGVGAVKRLSAESAKVPHGGILSTATAAAQDHRSRSGTVTSTISSVHRPQSCASGESEGSGESAGSHPTSVKWDEPALRTVREARRREREEEKEKKGSARMGDTRKRTPLASIFPSVRSASSSASMNMNKVAESASEAPAVTVQEPSDDGHAVDGDKSAGQGQNPCETPARPKVRQRPKSEQMLLCHTRPKAMYEESDGDVDNAVMSLLTGATDELAQLINTLDLEATPMSAMSGARSPLSATRRKALESPLHQLQGGQRKALTMRASLASLASRASLTSLRPYALKGHQKGQSLATIFDGDQEAAKAKDGESETTGLGRHIQPWEAFNAALSPPKSASKAKPASASLAPPSTDDDESHPASSENAPTLRARKHALSNASRTTTSSKLCLRPRALTAADQNVVPAAEKSPPIFKALRPSASSLRMMGGTGTLRPKASALAMAQEKMRMVVESESDPYARDGVAEEEEEEDKLDDMEYSASKGKLPFEQTFGSHSRSDSVASSLVHSPVFKKAHGHERKTSHLIPLDQRASAASLGQLGARLRCESLAFSDNHGLPLPLAPEARRSLAFRGTMGGSTTSTGEKIELDESDPDSDVPEELREIFARRQSEPYGHEEDEAHTISSWALSSPGALPAQPLPPPSRPASTVGSVGSEAVPVFCAQLIDEEDRHADVDTDSDHRDGCSDGFGDADGEDTIDTKQSFDFTGEILRLNESGAADRRSFVEQLENAFRTPASIDLGCSFALQFGDSILNADGEEATPSRCPSPNPHRRLGANVHVNDDAEHEVSWVEDDAFVEGEGEASMPSSLQVELARVARNPGGLSPAPMPYPRQSFPISVNLEPSLLSVRESFVGDSYAMTEDSVMHGSYAMTEDFAATDEEHDKDDFSPEKVFRHARAPPRLEGQLNMNFRFGGPPPPSSPPPPAPPTQPLKIRQGKPTSHHLTLSDIIPPPEVAFALANISTTSSEDSLLKSILAKAVELPTPPSLARKSSVFSKPPKADISSEASSSPVLKSILAKPGEVRARPRLDSNASSKRVSRVVFARSRVDSSKSTNSKRLARLSAARASFVNHVRKSSALSFEGFDSFGEVRRAFEFNDRRPNFYEEQSQLESYSLSPFQIQTYYQAQPHSQGNSHGKRFSQFSIPSISSYGRTINAGVPDPFDYGVGLTSLRESPSSDEFSVDMSSTVDDTFSFLRQRPHRRQRVDSGTSSFYFRTSVHSHIRPYSFIRNARRQSVASVISMAPPSSLYNRSFGQQRRSPAAHNRDDTIDSMSSVARGFANPRAGRMSWAQSPEFSFDSAVSDISSGYLGRPGLGDKMLDSCVPLRSINASPPESACSSRSVSMVIDLSAGGPGGGLAAALGFGDEQAPQLPSQTFDSIMDDLSPYSQAPTNRNSMTADSLFENPNACSSVSLSDSVFFGAPNPRPRRVDDQAVPTYRPVSSLSLASVHSPPQEDDTMISMLGGGQVRRRSVGSMIAGSPCARVEKHKPLPAEDSESEFEQHVPGYQSEDEHWPESDPQSEFEQESDIECQPEVEHPAESESQSDLESLFDMGHISVPQSQPDAQQHSEQEHHIDVEQHSDLEHLSDMGHVAMLYLNSNFEEQSNAKLEVRPEEQAIVEQHPGLESRPDPEPEYMSEVESVADPQTESEQQSEAEPQSELEPTEPESDHEFHFRPPSLVDDFSVGKSRVLETKPSIASSSRSPQFGDERMIKAKYGSLSRNSLEESALIASGEDGLVSLNSRPATFSRPVRASRSRSSTSASASTITTYSGVDTPPLSHCDSHSSPSESSRGSIDLTEVNSILANMSHGSSAAVFGRLRPRPRGHSHRKRISEARLSCASIYETIEEEMTTMATSTRAAGEAPAEPQAPTIPADQAPPPVFVVDPDAASVNTVWDEDISFATIRRYYALREEAHDTVQESKKTWLDTPFSLWAIQNFEPPRQRAGMREMLEQSQECFGPLPSELRAYRPRSRANSRSSPYPRSVKTSFTFSPGAEQARATAIATAAEKTKSRPSSALPTPLRQLSINPNISNSQIVSPRATGLKVKADIKPKTRPQVKGTASEFTSGTRRSAASWSKKTACRSANENKENSIVMNVSQGSMTSDTSLRLNRPRPRVRPTPAAAKPIRI